MTVSLLAGHGPWPTGQVLYSGVYPFLVRKTGLLSQYEEICSICKGKVGQELKQIFPAIDFRYLRNPARVLVYPVELLPADSGDLLPELTQILRK